MKIATVDFETEAIVGNPLVQPPSCLRSAEWPSAGVAIWLPGEDPWYAPCDDKEVQAYLAHLWADYEIVFHNAPFDLSVAQKWLGLEWPPWERIHDTQYLVFHYNPYGNLALKPAAEEILGWEPEERDELHDWIMANVPEATKKTAGAFTSKAPWEFVERYAIGDVERTWALFDFLMEQDLYDL